MKKSSTILIVALVVAGGLAITFSQFTNGTGTTPGPNETYEMPTPPPISPERAAKMAAERKKWESSPDGIQYNKWKASPEGRKIAASEAKISKSIRSFTNMEAVITSLSLPEGARLGFGMMVRIGDEDYILAFGSENPDKQQFARLRDLKVDDKIWIKSHSVSHAQKYAYPIVSGDYISKDGKILYRRVYRKGGC